MTKKITIEHLAVMVKRGFDDVTKNMAKQRDLDLLRTDVLDIKELKNSSFTRVNN